MSSKKKVKAKPIINKRPPKIELKKTIKTEDNKYLRVAMDDRDKLKSAGDRVAMGEMIWSYFTTENDKGYHYYLIKN